MTGIRAIVQDVIDTHDGRATTHYEECWRFHARCLAALILDELGREGDQP